MKKGIQLFIILFIVGFIGFSKYSDDVVDVKTSNTRILETLQEKVCKGIRTDDYSQEERDQADHIQWLLGWYDQGEKEFDLAIRSNDFSYYYKWLGTSIIAWVVLAAVSFLITQVLLCNKFCHSIIPCKFLRNRNEIHLKEKEEKYIRIGILLFSVVILVIISITISYVPDAYKGTKRLVCNSFKMVDVTNDGATIGNVNWKGLTNAKTCIDKMISNLNRTRDAMSGAFLSNATYNTEWIKVFYPELDTLYSEIYQLKNAYFIESPSPFNLFGKFESLYFNEVGLWINIRNLVLHQTGQHYLEK